jgi:hypothetical protein
MIEVISESASASSSLDQKSESRRAVPRLESPFDEIKKDEVLAEKLQSKQSSLDKFTLGSSVFFLLSITVQNFSKRDPQET